jgi:hypothetical protein
MKINWFHLMPYRWLPEDFRDCYRSVWVDIPGTHPQQDHVGHQGHRHRAFDPCGILGHLVLPMPTTPFRKEQFHRPAPHADNAKELIQSTL